MTKHKTTSLYFHPTVIFSHILPQFLKLSPVFVETSFQNWRCPKGC